MKASLRSLVLVVLLAFSFGNLNAQDEKQPFAAAGGETGLWGLGITADLFAGFNPFLIFDSPYIGDQYLTMFGFNLTYPNSNGQFWTMTAIHNSNTFVSEMTNNIWASIQGGQTWDFGTDIISNMTIQGGIGTTLAFDHPSGEIPGGNPLNPNLTLGGGLEFECLNGILSFGANLNILMDDGVNGVQEFNIETIGSIQLGDGTEITTCFDINSILQPNGAGANCGAIFLPSINGTQVVGKKERLKIKAGVVNPIKYGKYSRQLPVMPQVGLSYRLDL